MKQETQLKQIAIYLGEQFQEMDRLLRQSEIKLTETLVHDLRVATRRSRAALWMFAHSSAQLKFRKLRNRLRRLGQALGRAREIDVALRDARKYKLSASRLRALQRKERSRVKTQLRRTNGRKVLQREFSSALKKIESLGQVRFRQSLYSAGHLLQSWRERPIKNIEELHRFRIDLKKARYALETIGRPVKPLEKLQGKIGKGHDLTVLQNLAHKSNSRVKREKKKIFIAAKRRVEPVLKFALQQLQIH